MVLLDAAIMMNPNTWVASGHVGSFSDPLIECKDCNTRHRADKILEEIYKDEVMNIKKNWIHASAKLWVNHWETLNPFEMKEKNDNNDPTLEQTQ